MHAHVIKTETTAPASDSLTHQHHRKEWRQGRDRRDREAGTGRGCKTDMQSALLGEVADKKKKEGGGPLQGGDEGLMIVSHLHSPIKFLYFAT